MKIPDMALYGTDRSARELVETGGLEVMFNEAGVCCHIDVNVYIELRLKGSHSQALGWPAAWLGAARNSLVIALSRHLAAMAHADVASRLPCRHGACAAT